MTTRPTPLKGVYLETLSWKEAEPLLAANPVIAIPLGARLKEHGPHLPLNNDWIMAEHLARRVLERCDVVALPTVQYYHYPAFVEYPGSVTIGVETSRDLLIDICCSIARHGPKRFYVINTGVSTVYALSPAKTALATKGITLEYTNVLTAAEPVASQLRTQSEGTHADELETSIMLHLDPSIVRMHAAQRDIHPNKGPGGLTRNPGATTGTFSPTGSYGDPTLATAEKGRLLVDAKVASIVADIERLRLR